MIISKAKRITRRVKKEQWIVACIAVAALVARIAFIAAFVGFSSGPQSTGSDECDYLYLARSLAFEGTYALEGEPSVLRPPGYPIFAAIVFKIFGQDYVALRLAQCLVGAVTALFVYLIGKRCFSGSAGILAAAIFACYPYLVRFCGLFSSETLFIFLVTGSAYYLLQLKENPNYKYGILSGTFLGLATLTRPVTLLMYVFVPIWSLRVFSGRWRTACKVVSISLGVMSIFVGGWTMRNYLLTSKLIPVCTVGGRTFYASNHRLCVEDERFKGKCVDEVSLELTPERYYLHRKILTRDISRVEKELELSSSLQRLGQQFLLENVGSIPRLLFYKFRETWSPVIRSSRRLFDLIYLLSYGQLLPLFLVGLIMRARDGNAFIMILFIILMQIANLIYWGAIRFRLMVEPFIILFAAFAIVEICRWIFSKNRWQCKINCESSKG